MFLWVDNNTGFLFLVSDIVSGIYKEVVRLYSYITRSIGLRSIVDADN